jgi:CHAT domain
LSCVDCRRQFIDHYTTHSKHELRCSKLHYYFLKDNILVQEKIKILLLVANPKNTDPLRLGEEIREIDIILKQANHRDRFELIPKFSVRVGDLRDEMLSHSPQILHFSGHGVGNYGLALEDDQGQLAFVTTDALARFFQSFTDTVECVLLNACYSTVQAEAINQHINCVIGMNQAIGDRAAIEFAKGFYAALGAGRTIKAAFEMGCASLDLKNIPESSKPELKLKPGLEESWVNRKLIVVSEPETQSEQVATPTLQTQDAKAASITTDSDRTPTINAQKSQGLINNASAQVTQHFGNQTSIKTGGGDYAGRDMYKNDRSNRSDTTVSLQTVIDQVTELIEQAEDRDEDDLADDLRLVESSVQAAVKAETEGKLERRQAKLKDANRMLQELAKTHPDLRNVYKLIQQVQ